MDVITVDNLAIDCIVGVLEREQRATQRIEVTLRLGLDLEACGETGDLARGVDYAGVAEQVRLLAEHGRFRLIETLALGVCRMLLLPPLPGEGRAAIQKVEIEIRKPEILAPVCVPGVRFAREVGPVEDAPEQRIVEVPEGGAWRVRVPARGVWRPGDRAALVLAGSIGGRGPGERIARGGEPLEAASDAVLIAVGKR